ncbi:MAG: DUF4870 domain-containing protein [Candidatus Krumholzibacteria bacterium]|nr:DUF4870 domain-containing protein [Candidatus Krumholzibacteria bacterium]
MNQSSTGLSENVAGTLSYVLGWITGLVFLLVEKNSSFVRFHAMQSLITFGLLFIAGLVVNFLPGIGPLLGALLGILTLILWILLMLKAWSGQRYKLPWIGDEAEKQVGRMTPP